MNRFCTCVPLPLTLYTLIDYQFYSQKTPSKVLYRIRYTYVYRAMEKQGKEAILWGEPNLFKY